MLESARDAVAPTPRQKRASPVSTAIYARDAKPLSHTHLSVLDGIRGLAILLVLVRHASLALSQTATPDRWITSVFSFGWGGVDLFFVLSGFLITGILVDAKGTQHYFRNFYMRRSLRIFPLYYGFLAAVFLVLPLVYVGDAAFRALQDSQVWYWTYLVNFHKATSNVADAFPRTGHFWSLAVEEQFYLMWPLVVHLCAPKTLKKVCVAGVIAALALRIGFRLGGETGLAYALMPSRMDGLLLGALIAVRLREQGGMETLLRWAKPALPIGGMVLAGLWMRTMEFKYRDAVTATIGGTALVVCFAALLVKTLDAKQGTLLRGFFDSRVMRTFGKYAYGLYVFHWPLVDIVKKIPGAAPMPASPTSVMLQWVQFCFWLTVLSFIVSWVSWHIYEKQFLKLKKYFPM